MNTNHSRIVFWALIAVFIIYFVPTLTALLQSREIMPEFYLVEIQSPYAIVAIYLSVFLFILLLFLAAPNLVTHKITIKIPRIIFKCVLLFYVLLGVGCLIYLFIRLETSSMAALFLSGQMGEAKSMYNNIAAKMSESSLLKYYFLSMAAILGLYLSFHRRPALLLLSLAILSILYIFISRREVIFFIAALILSNPYIKKSWKYVFFAAASATFFALVLVRIIDPTQNDNVFYSYYSSQEFYPYQFGAFLLDRILLGYINVGFDGVGIDGTLAGFEQKRFFSFEGFGPTIGIIYSFVRLGVVPPSLYLLIYFSVIKIFGNLARRDAIYRFLTMYLLVKLLILMRNGEYVTNFVDVALFTALSLPVIFMRPGERAKVQRAELEG